MIVIVIGLCLWWAGALVFSLALARAAAGNHGGTEAQRKIKGESGGRLFRCSIHAPGLVSTIKESNSVPLCLRGKCSLLRLNPHLFGGATRPTSL